MNRLSLFAAASALFVGVSTALVAQSPSFAPDGTFGGSSLSGWQQVGSAQWSASNGEITGTGTGLLIFNKPAQDSAVYLQFRCEGECNAGILMRTTKGASGVSGDLLTIRPQELVGYHATFDESGKLAEHTQLRLAGGQIRFAPPPPAAGAPARRFTPPEPLPMPAGATAPLQRPVHGLRNGEWNDVEVLLDADILRAFFNDGGDAVSVATENMNGYGPFALYVGSGTVHFRAIAYKDIAVKTLPKEQVSPNFRMQRINEFYYGWSAAAADFNHDGKIDIVSGPFIYFGPDFTQSREIYPAQIVNASTNYSMEGWVQHAADFTGDGWPDVVTTSHADGGKTGAVLYVNPKGESRRWEKLTVVAPIDSEETVLADVDKDGKQELVYMGGGYMCYAKPDPSNPTGKWVVHKVSEHGPWPAHGVGAGDVNGDGRIDTESLARFVAAYQRSTALTLGELWAIPIMLRLALIENLRRVAARLAADQADRGSGPRRWGSSRSRVLRPASASAKAVLAPAAAQADRGPATASRLDSIGRAASGPQPAPLKPRRPAPPTRWPASANHSRSDSNPTPAPTTAPRAGSANRDPSPTASSSEPE